MILVAHPELARLPKPALLPELFPCPHPVGGLGGQWEAQLMRQHADLATMMGFMRDHVSEHGRSRGPRTRPPVAVKLADATARLCQHFRTTVRTIGQRNLRLLGRAAGTVKHRRS